MRGRSAHADRYVCCHRYAGLGTGDLVDHVDKQPNRGRNRNYKRAFYQSAKYDEYLADVWSKAGRTILDAFLKTAE